MKTEPFGIIEIRTWNVEAYNLDDAIDRIVDGQGETVHVKYEAVPLEEPVKLKFVHVLVEGS